MSVELILNVAILAFSIFCYWFVGATTPPSSMPGIMSAADWPRLILIGLVIALSINIVKLLRESKNSAGAEAKKWRELFPPRFIVAFVILVAYSIILEYHRLSSEHISFRHGLFRADRTEEISHLVLGDLCSSVAIYVIFQILLQVLLPRAWAFSGSSASFWKACSGHERGKRYGYVRSSPSRHRCRLHAVDTVLHPHRQSPRRNLRALPGVSASMAVALIVPFTFKLDPGFHRLPLCSLCAAITGGGIPAILFKIPGTPASAVTTFDGYPLAVRGESGRAMLVVLVSSAWGALFRHWRCFWYPASSPNWGSVSVPPSCSPWRASA